MNIKNKNNEGETDVNYEEPTHFASDIGEQSGWDEFQLYGVSATGESSYRSSSEQVDQALMERIRNRSIGRKIRQLDLETV